MPSAKEFDKEVRKYLRYYFGELVTVNSTFQIIELQGKNAIVRTNHKYQTFVEAAITLCGFGKFVADIKRKSGTIKSLKRKMKLI